MLKYGVLIVGCVLAAGYLAQKTDFSTRPVQSAEGTSATQTTLHSEPNIKKQTGIRGKTAILDGDGRGHFLATAKMNGRKVEVLVDTGATSVAINKKTARRLGIKLSNSDFKHEVNTANGKLKAASVVIDKISIGKVSVKNVRAAVLPDRALDGTLLGMSFLGELSGFYVQNNQLVMKQ